MVLGYINGTKVLFRGHPLLERVKRRVIRDVNLPHWVLGNAGRRARDLALQKGTWDENSQGDTHR